MRHLRYLTGIIVLGIIISLTMPSWIFAQMPIVVQGYDAQIAFTSGLEAIEDVYIMGTDGTTVRNLTRRGDASFPAWSPDGGKIAFVTYGDGNREIYVADADGTNQVRLTNNNVPDQFPAWSPDGTRIAFSSYRDGNWEVYIMNADGTNPINLTEHDAQDGSLGLAWAPDGRRIAFTSNRDTQADMDIDPRTNIYILDTDTQEVSRSTEGTSFSDKFPSWSPDGTRIVFVSDRNPPRWSEIYVIDIDDLELTRLTNQNTNELTYLYQYPAWSPDGQQIAFTACAEHLLTNCEIYVFDADGSNIVQLTDDNDADLQPAWMPVFLSP